jgi:putative two-component system response regulator
MRLRPILCVDDEPANLALMRQVLQDKYPLVFARSGAEALQATLKHLPRMILLDINMPDEDGFSVAKKLKEDPKTQSIPIIFVSTFEDEIDEAAGFSAGGVDYITKPVSPPILHARINTHLSLVKATELEKSYHAAIHMLGEAGHYNDTDTGVHIWRMGSYSNLLALASGWDRERANLLKLASPMHDTGKIGISDTLLQKPGKLTADEWIIMKTHPQIGYDILSKGDGDLFKLAAEVSLGHHEKWDGQGYPNSLSEEAIPESARIVAIADVFDALSMQRPYKEAWPLDKVMATIEASSDKHFEKRLVEIFKGILPQILELKNFWNLQEVDKLQQK